MNSLSDRTGRPQRSELAIKTERIERLPVEGNFTHDPSENDKAMHEVGLRLRREQIGVTRWDDKAGLRRDAAGFPVVDVLEPQEIKEIIGNEDGQSA